MSSGYLDYQLEIIIFSELCIKELCIKMTVKILGYKHLVPSHRLGIGTEFGKLYTE